MSTQRRGSWTVTALNGVVAVTVLVLVVVLALVVNPPAPPGIAAFAPQAAKPITKAPPGQSAQFGTGAGSCAAGQVCVRPGSRTSGASALPSASALAEKLTGAAPVGLQCFEWPDGSVTQTFDPQSPPCISRWDDSKGNGGATSPGVTATEIRVAYPKNDSQSSWPTLQPIVDFFNTRFQLYGRQIKMVPFHSQQADGNMTGDWNMPDRQRADAAAVAQLKVFATLDFTDPIAETWTLPVFMDAMAKHKIVSINGGDASPYGTQKYLASKAPYAWSYYQTLDQLTTNTATMICRQLVGKQATHAPDQSMRSKTRKFAVVIPTNERIGGPLPGLQTMLNMLDECGVHDIKVVQDKGGADSGMPASFKQLSLDGVTSVIYLPFGGSGTPTSNMVAAQQVNFTPEWILLGWNNYNTAFQLNDPPAETSGAFGVGTWNKQPQLSAEPWVQAAMAAGGDSTVQTMPNGRGFYQEMLMLASGIQMAGPKLTPEAFAEGLHTTTFPNPGAGTAPSYQGTVGFEGGDPIMVNDYTAFWLDSRTTGQEVSSSTGVNESKAFCAVELGRRWADDNWPRVDGYYTGTCR
jgi:hypothetical protein